MILSTTAVVIIEGSALVDAEVQEPFARTATQKNSPHPVWNEEFFVDTVIGPDTNLVVAILDDDKGDDDLVGKVRAWKVGARCDDGRVSGGSSSINRCVWGESAPPSLELTISSTSSVSRVLLCGYLDQLVAFE